MPRTDHSERIADLYRQGRTIPDIASTVGLSYPHTYRMVRALPEYRKRADADREKAVAMLRSGASRKEVLSALPGRSISWLSEVAIAAGLRARKPSDGIGSNMSPANRARGKQADDMRSKLVPTLIAMLLRHGWTPAELAARLGVSVNAVCKWAKETNL